MSRIWPIGGVFLLVVSAGLLIAESRKSPPELPVYGRLPDFALTDHRQKPLAATSLKNRTTVVNVVFTRCPTVCPVVTLKLKKLEQATRDLGDRVAFVSFSVDPGYDTPQVLSAFADKFGAQSPRWHFVTGPAEGLTQRIENGLKIALDRRGEDPQGVPDIIHGTHFVLVDGNGQIRGYYDSDDPDRLTELERDLRQLVVISNR